MATSPHLRIHELDAVVVGAGGAGLRAAIAASDSADVLVLAKDTIEQSNTWYAQGGIAAVLQPEDSYQSHVNDTETAGAGDVPSLFENGPACAAGSGRYAVAPARSRAGLIVCLAA